MSLTRPKLSGVRIWKNKKKSRNKHGFSTFASWIIDLSISNRQDPWTDAQGNFTLKLLHVHRAVDPNLWFFKTTPSFLKNHRFESTAPQTCSSFKVKLPSASVHGFCRIEDLQSTIHDAKSGNLQFFLLFF